MTVSKFGAWRNCIDGVGVILNPEIFTPCETCEASAVGCMLDSIHRYDALAGAMKAQLLMLHEIMDKLLIKGHSKLA